MSQVWLVTGSSRGLGRAIVEAGLLAGNKAVSYTHLDVYKRQWFSPGGYCSGHSHLLFQKRSVHCDPISCRSLILSSA